MLMMISSTLTKKSVVLVVLFKGALIPKLPLIFSTTSQECQAGLARQTEPLSLGSGAA